MRGIAWKSEPMGSNPIANPCAGEEDSEEELSSPCREGRRFCSRVAAEGGVRGDQIRKQQAIEAACPSVRLSPNETNDEGSPRARISPNQTIAGR